ncbi:MAG: hypothetical protein DHS20C12_06310 [Pseudohongiella sp.]|nr:MAG: hypothetical protein DHS20C12_06310 [Pseudohongiella sp.]
MTEFIKVIEWNRTRTILWWLLFLLCLAYAGFAFEMFRGELNRVLDAAVSTEPKVRESPIAFMLHAVMGGVGLVSGALQFNSAIRRRSIAVHRTFGWIYLLSIWGGKHDWHMECDLLRCARNGEAGFSWSGNVVVLQHFAGLLVC